MLIIRQLVALVWRNFLLRFRNWGTVTIELGFPMLLLYLVVYRCNFEPHEEKSSPFWPRERLYPPVVRKEGHILYYFPNTKATRDFIRYGSDSSTPLAIPVDDPSEVPEGEGLILQLDFENKDYVPRHLKFMALTRRQYSRHKMYNIFFDELEEKVFQIHYIVTRMFIHYWWNRGARNPDCNFTAHMSDDFVDAANPRGGYEIFLAVTELFSWRTLNSHHQLMRVVFPFFFIGLVCFTTQALVQDKKSGAKAMLKDNGTNMTIYWTSWFITSFSIGIVPGLMFGLAYSLDFENVDYLTLHRPLVTVSFMLLYTANTISFSFMISSVIKKTRHSIIISGTLFFIARFTTPLLQRYINTRFRIHVTGCLVYQSATILFDLLIIENKEGVIDSPYIFFAFHEAAPECSLVDPFFMLMSNSMFNLAVLYYLENIKDVQRKLLSHWFFLLKSRMYLPEEFSLYMQSNLKDSRSFDPTVQKMLPSIKLRALKKVYNNEVAIDISKLDAYKDEITVLFGTNGSGKTTTLKIIYGAELPTEGSALVNGYDVSKSPKKVTHCVAMCPQDRLFHNKLTCLEHLHLYSVIQNPALKSTAKICETLLKEVGLEDVSNEYTVNLSPGQIKRLCVAVTFTGNKSIILLDDPFSGLDSNSKRIMWRFLKSKRLFRTILVSTHSTEDALAVGDNIIVISHGAIRCRGTPKSINNLYGYNFKLNMTKGQNCTVKDVTKVVRHHVPDVKMSEDSVWGLQFLIASEKIHYYPEMLKELETKQDQLQISNIELLTTSIKDLLLGIRALSDERTNTSSKKSSAATSKEKITIESADDAYGVTPSKDVRREIDSDNFAKMTTFETLSYFKHHFRQIKALFSMRCLVFLRNKHSTFAILSIPVAYTLVGMLLDYMSWPIPNSDPIVFGHDMFERDLTFQVLVDDSGPSGMVQKYIELVRPHGKVSEHYLKLRDLLANDSFFEPYEFLTKTYTHKEIVNIIRYTVANVKWQDEVQRLTLYVSTKSLLDKPKGMSLVLTAWVMCALGHDYSVKGGVKFDRADEKLAKFKYTFVLRPWRSGTVLFSVIFMALISLSFIYSLIVENKNGTKRLQLLNGVSLWMYWSGQFLFDITFYGIMVIPHLVALFFSSGQDFWILSVGVITVYGFTLFPYLYALHFFFSQPVTGVGFVFMVNIFIGVLGSMAMKFHFFYTKKVAIFNYYYLVDHAFKMATPIYELTFILQMAVYTMKQPGETRHQFDYVSGEVYFRMYKYFWEYITHSAIQMAVYWSVVIFCELGIHRYIGYKVLLVHQFIFKSRPDEADKEKEETIKDEVSKVDSVTDASDSILLKHVTKCFFSCYTEIIRVADICLHITANELLCLAGPNGAGKSVTLQMVSGAQILTAGDILVDKLSVKSHLNTVRHSMIHCPQDITLAKRLTGKETLVYYARLKGVPGPSVETVVQAIIHFVSLTYYENQQIKMYSESLKRKLFLGVCLIKFPKFLLLDDPTSGLDIVARRKMFALFELINANGSTIVLASDSLDEFDEICTRVAVLKSGRMIKLGEPQQILSDFGQGCVVTLHALLDNEADGRRSPLDDAESFIVNTLPTAQVITKQEELLEIHVPQACSHSDLYDTLAKAKMLYPFGHFQVQRLTLAHVINSSNPSLSVLTRTSTPVF